MRNHSRITCFPFDDKEMEIKMLNIAQRRNPLSRLLNKTHLERNNIELLGGKQNDR